jgi:hypothetical protein
MNNLKSFGLVLALTIVGFASTASARPSLQQAPRDHDTVQWGGEGISVQVDRDENRANLTFDCASGKVNHIHLDKKGGFLASGTFTQGSGVRPPNPPEAQPAHYVGFAKNGTMSLMVVIDSDPAHSATYLLKKGAPGDIHLCE